MKNIIPFVALAILVLSCKRETDVRVKHGEQLSFTTESSILRDGDLVGVSMDSPLSYINVKMTYGSGNLTPGNKLYWPVNMPDSAVTFLAYHPYSASYNEGGVVVFSAEPDQRSDEAFRASRLLVAQTKASVNEPSVKFDFEHKMSKLIFYVRNDSGSKLEDVYLTAYPSLQFNMDKVDFRVCGEKVDIHAHNTATSSDGVDAYEAIIAPQKTTLTLTLKTASAEYTAMVDTKVEFKSGKQYSNYRLATLDPNKASRPISFTLVEADWKELPDYSYLEPISGGTLEEFTDLGVYRMQNGSAVPIRTYAAGSDQYSLISGTTSAGWRLMNPALGEMFEFTTPMTYNQEGNSYTINIRSFGLSGFEADYSSTASTIKTENGLVWTVDENKDYGYIIATE
ncbi:MAG: fimbrillin family protein [Bacteroidales bacterium]|nr:fimbrillin family protein [Bacteroidales bacterium]